MAYSRYLSSVVRSLRDEVGPAVSTPEARDSLGSCLRTLAMITSSLERMEERLGEGPALSSLPPDLARALAPASARSGRGFRVPTDTIADDAPGGTAWEQEITTASLWMRQLPREAFDSNVDAISALVAWEQALRADQFARSDALSAADGSGTTAQFHSVRKEELENYLQCRFEAALQITDFRFIVGGRSRQTILFAVEGSDALPGRLVVQRDHPANINPDGGVGIQFPLLEVLHRSGLRVPRPILYEVDRGPLGAPFMITEQVSGSTVIDAATEYYAPPPRSARLARSIARQMARLHQVPMGALEGKLKRPVAESDPNGWRRDLERIRTRWHAQSTGPSIAVEAAFAWLARNVGRVAHRTAIVHTDMLLHNLLVVEEEVSAVLDWEIAHFGHPAEDLGYVRPVIEQMISWQEFMDEYRAAGGAELTPVEVDWFSLRQILNLATMGQFSRSMVEQGKSDDIRIAETGANWLPRLKGRLATTFMTIVHPHS